MMQAYQKDAPTINSQKSNYWVTQHGTVLSSLDLNPNFFFFFLKNCTNFHSHWQFRKASVLLRILTRSLPMGTGCRKSKMGMTWQVNLDDLYTNKDLHRSHSTKVQGTGSCRNPLPSMADAECYWASAVGSVTHKCCLQAWCNICSGQKWLKPKSVHRGEAKPTIQKTGSH